MGHSKGSPEKKFIMMQAYLKKKKIETFQNTLTLHLQNSKNNKDSPEQVEGRK